MTYYRQIRVYTASKLKHAEMLRGLARDGFHFTARWPWLVNLPAWEAVPASQWQQDNFDDISRSEALLVYVEFGEHLKGGLVEVGVALAYKIPIWVVGEHTDYSKWRHHPGVHRAGTIDAALAGIRRSLGNKDERILV